MADAGGDALLPALREDLSLYEGPPNAFGAPTWTLYDPPGNRFYRISWPEFEMLSRWQAGGSSAALAREVSSQTTLSVDGIAIDQLREFLERNSLLQIQGAGQVRRLRLDWEARQPSWFARLLRSHLFIRLPLIRPAPLLAALQPIVRGLYTKSFAVVTLIVGLIGLYLAARQWDRFLDTFVTLFEWSSLLLIAATIIFVKVLHEMGHALTAHRFGCHVPTMGVALMVFWPVLYTDTTDAWKLTSKRQRLAISGAGICTELIVAVYATLAWTFLPDGPLQSAAFLVATTTWILSILINLNPFMRFDGYFLFADLLEVENLQERAFALARWRLREALFGLGDPPPESWPRGKRTTLLAYAYMTWAYRAVLFFGIALLIYHFLFKLAGILLLVLEIILLIGLPVMREAKVYWHRAGDMTMNRQTIVTIVLVAAAVAALSIPWDTHVTVPSLLRPETHAMVYAPATARIESLNTEEGQRVRSGDALARLQSQDLENAIAVARIETAVLERRLAFERFDKAQRQNRLVVESKLRTAQAKLAGLQQQRKDLTVTAPADGTVVELAEDVRANGWVAEGEPVLLIAENGRSVIDAYVPEAQVGEIEIGAAATFYPENLDTARIQGKVATIDPVAVTSLDAVYLASKFGGGIDVTETESGRMVPRAAHYRVRIELPAPVPLARIARGSTVIAADQSSLVARAWTAVVAIVVRESGF